MMNRVDDDRAKYMALLGGKISANGDGEEKIKKIARTNPDVRAVLEDVLSSV